MTEHRPILVTGATGFAGSHLLDLLVADAAPVVAWHRPNGRRGAPHPSGRVRWAPMDMLDRAAVTHAIAALLPASIYHCAGAAHVGRSWENTRQTLELNVLGTHYLLEAVRTTCPDAQVLVPGSALVYRPSTGAMTEDTPVCPESPYGVSKLAQEMRGARAHRVDGSHVLLPRAFNHTGPGQAPTFVTSGFAQQVAAIEAGERLPVIEVGNLESRRDLTDVRDTVRAYQLIMERGIPGRVYNVCSGRAHRVGDLLQALVDRARVKVDIKVDPGRVRPMDNPLVLGDPARLRDETGWEPRIPIEQTLEDLLAFWRRTYSERTALH
jgi:GDP-4-dehydro-6-deoxy-D-mannose reductase